MSNTSTFDLLDFAISVKSIKLSPVSNDHFFQSLYQTIITSILIGAGHAYAEYANDADYAHMRNMRMRMRIENLIHIIHIWIFAKNGNF